MDVEEGFKNAVDQTSLMNPGVNFVLTRNGFLQSMVDGCMVVPDFLEVADGHVADSLKSPGEPVREVQPQPNSGVHHHPEEQPQPSS